AALDEAKDLRQAQANVNAACQNQGQASGQGENRGANEETKESKNPDQANSKDAKNNQKQSKQGQGKGKEGEGKGKEGEGKKREGDQGKPAEDPSDQKQNQDPVQVAEKENQLSKDATALAEKLQRLVGKD